MKDRVGCVVIGRNEGERLVRCLDSLVRSLDGRADQIVYVDSGSTDGSVPMAESKGVAVVALDMTKPFTAARGRNAGFERLLADHPSLELVQFVDGDCEVVDGWIERGAQHLGAHPALAVVCGRRRERHPEDSVYNALCDLEWATPVGEARACGGDALMRVAAFRAVGGFDATLIAGEEPELCFRLREKGWKIERLDAEMTLHDAAIMRFDQWWKRNVRTGHAYAEGAHLHGASPERFNLRENLKIVLWGAVLPVIAVTGAVPTLGTSLLLLGGYPLNVARIYARTRGHGMPDKLALAYAVAMVLVKFPEAQGVAKYWRGRMKGVRSRIIEYK